MARVAIDVSFCRCLFCSLAVAALTCALFVALLDVYNETLEKDGFSCCAIKLPWSVSMAIGISDQRRADPAPKLSAYSRNTVVRLADKHYPDYEGKVHLVEVNAGVNSTYTIKYPGAQFETGVRHKSIIGWLLIVRHHRLVIQLASKLVCYDSMFVSFATNQLFVCLQGRRQSPNLAFTTSITLF